MKSPRHSPRRSRIDPPKRRRGATSAAAQRSATTTPFVAIADSTRRAILDDLRATPAGRTVGEIASGFTISRPAISKHLRILRAAHLVRERRDGRRRIYTLDSGPLSAVDGWLAAYRAHWAATLIDLKDFVEGEQE